MGLLGEVQAEAHATRRPCFMEGVRERLGDDAAELDAIVSGETIDPLTGKAYSLGSIARALGKRNISVSEETLRKHRRGECRSCAE